MKSGKIFVDRFVKVLQHIAQFSTNLIADLHPLSEAFQTSTRLLQAMCAFVKSNSKDSTLTREVPALRKSIETVVHKTREIFHQKGKLNTLRIGKKSWRRREK
jgi:hypothetical protein